MLQRSIISMRDEEQLAQVFDMQSCGNIGKVSLLRISCSVGKKEKLWHQA
jgi:hypothetical protein